MIKSVVIVINFRKRHPVLLGKEMIRWFAKKGIHVYAPPEDGAALGLAPEQEFRIGTHHVDCVITLGGDGTFLRAARMAAPHGVPILGINMGTLGFLTEVEVGEIEATLEKLLEGNYCLEDRTMLEAVVARTGRKIDSFVGLNDVVINKGPLARLITLEIYVGEEYVTTYKADGVIVASPTGSTAYSLSAGGPICYPEVDVTIITPICPHTLQAWPLVIPSNQTVRVLIINEQDSMLTIDGQHGFELHDGDEIMIGKAPYVTRLVRIKKHDFFSVLREKLKAEGRIPYE